MLNNNSRRSVSKTVYCLLLSAFCLVSVGCRYDMQDQPRYKAYKQSDFFSDNRASRDLPEGSVPRGFLREDKAFYAGKTDAVEAPAAPNPAATPAVDSTGNTLMTDFSGLVGEFPIPVTKELIDRGEQRYKVFCIVCHGPVGNGDGMIVRRGYSKPPTYNDDRLRNAPVGHFFDVITNGQGKMNGYAAQIPPADRWAIVSYIRALQISQNPNGNMSMTPSRATNSTSPTSNTNTATSSNANNAGGMR